MLLCYFGLPIYTKIDRLYKNTPRSSANFELFVEISLPVQKLASAILQQRNQKLVELLRHNSCSLRLGKI